jgi:hypothetical protein
MSLPGPSLSASTALSLRRLNRATLARQVLLARERMSVDAMVARLAGMQAQLARPPFIGLWTRLEGFGRDALVAALLKRRVVRATAWRGTLHLLTAADYLALRAGMQPALDRALQWNSKRLTASDRKALEPAGRVFFATPAPFDGLRKFLAARYPKSDHRAMAYAIRLTLPLVQVPTEADTWGFPGAASFALADRWLKRKIPPARPETAAEIVRRYLAAFGPATIADARVWSGIQNLKEVFEDLRPTLVTFRDERQRELFDLPDAPRPDEDAPAPIRFLPDYDNLLLAHDDRSRVIAADHRARVTSQNLQIAATFLVDGFIAGTWKVERKIKTAVLVAEPFTNLPRTTKAALETEGHALLAFVEPDATSHEMAIR